MSRTCNALIWGTTRCALGAAHVCPCQPRRHRPATREEILEQAWMDTQ